MISLKSMLTALLLVLSGQSTATSKQQFAAAKLRHYCQACHGVGKLRFIYSDNDQETWNFIFTNNAPNLDKTWAEAIHEVLNWPTEEAPAPDQPMDPQTNRDWMPKGAKRLEMAEDKFNDEFVRHIILRAIENNP